MNQINTGRPSLRSALLLGAASATAIALSLPAFAQDQAPVETVVVTGSRIPQQGLYSSSPVTAIGQQELKFSGTVNIETALRDLPAFGFNGDNSTANNGSAGLATVDLRNLGNQRTLVLVDGKRLVPSDNAETIDTNIIPANMVDHIEVLTGGASAVYGADAVAGVVNIITRKDFEGIEADVEYQVTGNQDGATKDANFLMGANSGDGKGNVTVYGGFTDRDQILQGARPYSAQALHSPYFSGCVDPNATTLCPAGSAAIAEGLENNTGDMFTADRTLVPYDGRTFNFAPYNYYQTPNNRYTFGATGHYEVDKALDFYTRLTFADSNTPTQLAPSPLVAPFNVNFGNPLISDQERGILFDPASASCDPAAGQGVTGPTGAGGTFLPNDTCQIFLVRRFVENGPRTEVFNYTSYQMVTGVKGDLGYSWTYDVSAQFGRTNGTQSYGGDASLSRFQQGLLVNPDGTCFDASNSCAPVDIFQAENISPAAVSFVTQPMQAISDTSEWDILASMTGELGQYGIKSPWAKSGLAVAFGGEYRQEEAHYNPDDNLARGNLIGFGPSPAVSGGYDVSEGFVEVRMPLIQGQPFFEDLSVNGGYRYSSYNVEGNTNTYKYGLEWQPIDDFRLRGNYQRAVRAPNVGELFAPQSISQNSGNDPCSAGTGPGGLVGSAALCEATGVPTANVGSTLLNAPSNQFAAVIGGNADLMPETSDTWSIGGIITPTFIDGLSATVDYYDIKLTGAVSPFGGSVNNIFTGCYSPTSNPSQSPDSPFCQAIHRDSFGRAFGNSLTGGRLDLLNKNVANFRTKGVDFELNYQNDLDTVVGLKGGGSFAVNFYGTLSTSFTQQLDPSQPVVQCKGLFGNVCVGPTGLGGAPILAFKSSTRFTWFSPGDDISVSLRWRHLSSAEFDDVALPVTEGGGLFDPVDAKIPAFEYFDLSGTWTVHHGIELRGGVTNIFDRDPPLVDINLSNAGVDSGNTFPGTYDAIGRLFFVGATVKY